MKELLSSRGLKVTRQRLLLLEALKKAGKPLTITNLMTSEKILTAMNESTLYRSLNQMSAAGIIYQTNFGTNSTYYELQESHHHHVTCNQCGHREKLDLCGVEDKLPSKVKNFHLIKSHVLEFFGICDSCNINN